MQNKKELIEKIDDLSNEKKSKLPSHSGFYGVNGNIRRVQTAHDSYSNIWDIMKTERGYAYFETNEKGIIRLSRQFPTMEETVAFVWNRFESIINGKES